MWKMLTNGESGKRYMNVHYSILTTFLSTLSFKNEFFLIKKCSKIEYIVPFAKIQIQVPL